MASQGKAVVLIDGGYFGKVREALGRPQIDFVKFSDAICDPFKRFRTYYYDAPPWMSSPPTQEQKERMARKQRFLDSLSMLPRFEVRLGEVIRIEFTCDKGPPHEDFIQKLVDVLLSVDMVRLAWSKFVEMIVLVSGDSDFIPAVQAAKDANAIVKHVYCDVPGSYVHGDLKKECDERLPITRELIDRCLRQTHK